MKSRTSPAYVLEEFCKCERPNFWYTAIVAMIFAAAGYFFLVNSLLPAVQSVHEGAVHDLYPIISMFTAIFCVWLLLLSVTSVIMCFCSNGKYWKGFTYQPCWYDRIAFYRRRIFPVDKFADLMAMPFRGKVLLSDVTISDISSHLKWEPSDEGDVEVFRILFTINCEGVDFRGIEEGNRDDVERLKKCQDKRMKVIGSVQGMTIVKCKIFL